MPTHRGHHRFHQPGQRRSRLDPALPTTHIEVMVDTNAHGREMDADIKMVRQLLEFRDYMHAASQVVGMNYEVSIHDTAQIFHEKCSALTPELAAEAGLKLPRMMEANLKSGIYHVEPPVHGEDEYYTALATFFLAILPDIDPQALKDRNLKKPEDFTPRDLQDLFIKHLRSGNWKERFNGTKHEPAFRAFHKVRFNAGEETAINYLRTHPYAPNGERTAFLFVGSDKWANKTMATARSETNEADRGRFEVFVGGPHQFKQMIERVVLNVEGKHPELKQIRRARFQSLTSLMDESRALADIAPLTMGMANRQPIDWLVTEDFTVPTPSNNQGNKQEVNRFADFVLDSREAGEPKRSQGR